MSRQATDKKLETTAFVDCPRCEAGRKYDESTRKKPYSFKRLTRCVGDCFLCCDMHRIPEPLAAAYRLCIPNKTPDAGVSSVAVVMNLKRDFFGEDYRGQ